MNLNRSQHAAFYGGMILFVVILFHAVTAYGERNLKAQPAIGGRYVSTTAPPGCPDRDRLVLDIQQSGVYLNVFLAVQPTNAIQSTEVNSERQPTFTGKWQQTQISLAGKTDAFATCTASAQPSTKQPTVTPAMLQGEVTTQPEKQFVGQLNIGDGAQPWQFQAQKQVQPKAKGGGH
jgi:hypothetical protein